MNIKFAFTPEERCTDGVKRVLGSELNLVRHTEPEKGEQK